MGLHLPFFLGAKKNVDVTILGCNPISGTMAFFARRLLTSSRRRLARNGSEGTGVVRKGVENGGVSVNSSW